MKRFSFFLAVFSVGLVLFLLLTGQFGKMFSGRTGEPETPIAGPEGGTGIPEENRNEVTFHKHDYTKGRLQMTIRGVIEEDDLPMSTEVISRQRTLRDARLSVPDEVGEVPVTARSDLFEDESHEF